MPLRNEFLEAGVIVWHWGVVTGEELLHSNRAIYEHRFADRFMFQLLDLTRVTDLKVTPQVIKSLAGMDTAMTAEHPQVGVVIAETDFIFGMGRMWNIQAENDSFETTVVRTMGEAIEILQKRGIDIEEPIFQEGESTQ